MKLFFFGGGVGPCFSFLLHTHTGDAIHIPANRFTLFHSTESVGDVAAKIGEKKNARK